MTTDDRRAALIDALADHILVHGLTASSLRPLAQAAGLSDRMLLYHFKDKAEVIDAALDCIMGRFSLLLAAQAAPEPLPLAQLQERLAELVLDDTLWPFMRLWLEIASLAARGDVFYRRIGSGMGRGFLAWGESQLTGADSAARAADAAQLLMTIEGMVVLKSVGLEDICRLAAPG